MAKTPEGKRRSSRNALKHGLRAKNVFFLTGESRVEYERTREGWMRIFRPVEYGEMRLVEQLILNDWLLRRANRRLAEAEMEEPGDKQEQKLALMLRYKASAERAFYRAYEVLEGMRRERLRLIRSELRRGKAKTKTGTVQAEAPRTKGVHTPLSGRLPTSPPISCKPQGGRKK